MTYCNTNRIITFNVRVLHFYEGRPKNLKLQYQLHLYMLLLITTRDFWIVQLICG